ncbi:hypothetical protein BH18THE2_BH18THE2_43500 [soil metagenome]
MHVERIPLSIAGIAVLKALDRQGIPICLRTRKKDGKSKGSAIHRITS